MAGSGPLANLARIRPSRGPQKWLLLRDLHFLKLRHGTWSKREKDPAIKLHVGWRFICICNTHQVKMGAYQDHFPTAPKHLLELQDGSHMCIHHLVTTPASDDRRCELLIMEITKVTDETFLSPKVTRKNNSLLAESVHAFKC